MVIDAVVLVCVRANLSYFLISSALDVVRRPAMKILPGKSILDDNNSFQVAPCLRGGRGWDLDFFGYLWVFPPPAKVAPASYTVL
jgi:hypothetical protein